MAGVHAAWGVGGQDSGSRVEGQAAGAGPASPSPSLRLPLPTEADVAPHAPDAVSKWMPVPRGSSQRRLYHEYVYPRKSILSTHPKRFLH